MPRVHVALVLVACLALVPFCYGIGCIDPSGKPVDWWIMYKLALGADPPPAAPAKTDVIGMQFSYLDASTGGTTLPLAEGVTIDDASTALGRTLTQIYEGSDSDTGYVFYNDEPPHQTPSSVHGHTKGVVGLDSSEGFWLIHSTPKFPEGPSRTSTYDFPTTEDIYGQTFFCLSFDLATLDQVGTQLQFNRPQIYDSNIPSSLASQVPELQKAANGVYVNAADNNVVTMETVSGTQLVSFAKTSKWGKDLYGDFVSTYFKQSLVVETWMRPHRPDCCDCQYPIVNVNTLVVGGFSFKETQDHSKWAITTTGSVVCIGDINRNKSQRKRGGGTMCFSNPSVHTRFHNAVTSTEPCPSQ